MPGGGSGILPARGGRGVPGPLMGVPETMGDFRQCWPGRVEPTEPPIRNNGSNPAAGPEQWVGLQLGLHIYKHGVMAK